MVLQIYGLIQSVLFLFALGDKPIMQFHNEGHWALKKYKANNTYILAKYHSANLVLNWYSSPYISTHAIYTHHRKVCLLKNCISKKVC